MHAKMVAVAEPIVSAVPETRVPEEEEEDDVLNMGL
jgi:hypothetical protein